MRRKAQKQKRLFFEGEEFDSKVEVEVYKSLKRMKRNLRGKFKIGHETEKLPYVLPPRNYIPDFVITKEDGSTVIIEVKGFFDPEARAKMLAVKDCHPSLKICFIFTRDQPVRKSARMKYSDWCEKHGFDYAINEIKKEWLV